MTQAEREKLKAEAAALREEVVELSRRIGHIDRELGPVWAAENEVREQIRQTHAKTEIGTLIFTPADRKAMFERLLQSAIDHGATKAQRSRFSQMARAYIRRAQNIEKELKRKKVKPDDGQHSLF